MGSHFHDWIDYNGVKILVELLEWQFCVFGLAYCAKTFAPNVAVGIALSHLKLSFYADTSGPEFDTNSSSRDLGLMFPCCPGCCVPGVWECGAKRGDRLGDFVCPVCSSATAEAPPSTKSLLLAGVECFLLELLSRRDIKIP